MERNIIDPEMEYSDNPYCVTETIPEDIRNMTFEELERAIAEEESKIQNRKKVSTHRSAGFRGSQIRPVENLESLFTPDQLSFIKEYIIDFNSIPSAFESLSSLLMTKGIKNNDVNEIGLMCESILDIIGDYDE